MEIKNKKVQIQENISNMSLSLNIRIGSTENEYQFRRLVMEYI